MLKQIAIKYLELSETLIEAINYLKHRGSLGKISYDDLIIFDRISEVCEAIQGIAVETKNLNRIKEILLNIKFYQERIKVNYSTNNVAFLYDLKYHYCPLLKILVYEVGYLVENFVEKEAFPDIYPDIRNIDHEKIIKKSANTKCLVSIVLLAYNNMEYTKLCLKSILDNTNDIDYELVLVDNASTDQTKEYFDSIVGAKVIHLEHNLHATKGFNIGLMASEGKYCAAICNDFIFTYNWLKNLIECIESDDRIGFVSPGATYISNMQQINIPFKSINQFYFAAKKYNVSEPRKWEERIVLLPNVLCSPTALLEAVGYYDPRYYRGEFADDDISFKIRRAGYKLIYCGDTIVHHYGSRSTVSDHETSSLEEGRKIFQDKYHLDAWLDARMSSYYLNLNYQLFSNVHSMLGIDVKCGATMMQIKNKIWCEFGNQVKITTATSDKKYLLDLQTISERAVGIDRISDLPNFLQDRFDLIYLEQPLDDYAEKISEILSILSQLLSPKGQILFIVNNGTNIQEIDRFICSGEVNREKRIPWQSLCKIVEKCNYQFSHVLQLQISLPQGAEQYVDALAKSLAAIHGGKANEYRLQLLTSHRVISVCRTA